MQRDQVRQVLSAKGVPSVWWSEDALAHYGAPTVTFDPFVLVEEPRAVADLLARDGFARVPHNSGYQFMPDMTEGSFRLSMEPERVYDDRRGGATAFVLLPCSLWHYPTELLSVDEDKDFPTLDAFVSALIDKWIDAETMAFRARMGTYLAYINGHVMESRTNSFLDMLSGYHREFWQDYNERPVRQRARDFWRQRRIELTTLAEAAQETPSRIS